MPGAADDPTIGPTLEVGVSVNAKSVKILIVGYPGILNVPPSVPKFASPLYCILLMKVFCRNLP